MLTGFFGVDIPLMHQSGHLWATLLGLGPIGWVIEMVIAFVVIVAGVSLVIQGASQTYIGRPSLSASHPRTMR